MNTIHIVLVLSNLLISVSAQENEWRPAHATVSKQKDGPIITEGACGYGDLHRSYGNQSASISQPLFNRGSTCGSCFELKCVNSIKSCLTGSPSVVVTATDYYPCSFPRENFELSISAFSRIAHPSADLVQIHYRRVNCWRIGGVRYSLRGSGAFFQVLITNVGSDGEVVDVKVKGSRTGWITMGRNWGQNWQSFVNLHYQPLSFEVTLSSGETLISYAVVPASWQFGMTFEGKQFKF